MSRSSAISLRFVLYILIAVVSSPAIAQNLTGHNWYFGNSNQAIRFNRTNNTPTLINTKATPFGTGGSAVATDPVNGNLLFYTDGNNIYDVTNTIMPSGTGLGANTSGNQPVAIAKVPGQANQYYVFTNTANFTAGGSVSYRIVDMALFGNAAFPTPALGDATSAVNTPIPALAGVSEAMITVQHSNGNDFWLITHANGTPDYNVTLFNSTGPVSTTIFAGVGLIEVAANFGYHAGTGRIAVSPQETQRDVEVVSFDNITGTILLGQRILNTGRTTTINQAIYDVEWSPSGQLLYISRHGDPGAPPVQADVLQYDLLNPLTSLASVLPQPNNIFRSYGLQLAPDTVIYHLYQAVPGGPFLLGSISDPDNVASNVVYDPSAFNANPNFNGTQFPSFAPKDTVQLTVNFTSQGTCSNTPTSFFPTVSPSADSLVWDFGDGQGAREWSPVHTYQAGGAFNVRVRAFLQGDTASFSQTINITQFDLQLTLVQDTTACACELPINNGKTMANGSVCPNDTSDDFNVTVQTQGGSPTFQWFGPGGALTPPQTTATLRPDSAGYYYVIARIGSCEAYAGVNIKEYDSLDQRANIWYFGQNAGIDFNTLPGNPLPITGPVVSPEGTAVISDRNGQAIISTNGFRIFDQDDLNITPPPIPPGLGGDSTSTQSSLIIPVPNDETLFYIFTTEEIYGTYTYRLLYSLYDLKKNQVVISNQELFSPSTERITGNANWLIAHEYGNNSFRSYRITQQGIGNPVISSIGADHSTTSAENGQGYMKLGAQNRLAVALSTPGVSNVVEVFDFTDSTGVVSNHRVANLNNTAGQVYGVEISPGGNKLFASLKNIPSRLYEFAFDSLGTPYLKQSVTQNGEVGAMQTGPDGQIYVAINNSPSLGTFTAVEDTTQITPLTNPLQPFNLAPGTQSHLGLPNFIQNLSNPTATPSLAVNGACVNDSIRFSATGKDPAIDRFDWFFGDGQGAPDGGPQVSHLYGAPGTYTVSVRIYNKCENPVTTLVQQITINGNPFNPQNVVPMCFGYADLNANPMGTAGQRYVWSTGDTLQTIRVTEGGTYNVTITNAAGCTTDAIMQASDNRPNFPDFGPDITMCQNTPGPVLNVQNPGATHAWTLNGVPDGSGPTRSVDTSTPNILEYKVQVTDPITGCFVRDSIIYTINESPLFTVATPNSPIPCGSSTGEITLTFDSPTNTLFTYSITGPSPSVSGVDQATLSTTSTGTTLMAGAYGITVSDQITGCTTLDVANIDNNAFTVGAVQDQTCDPIRLNVTLTPTPGPIVVPLTYRVIDNNTLVVEDSDTKPTNPFTTTNPLPSNNQQYVVEVTSGGCVASSPPVTVNEGARVTSTFTTNLCTNPITITANGGTGWLWTSAPPNNIISANNIQTISANPPPGNQTYNVIISQAGLCNLDTTITVSINNSVVADFTQSTACADQVVLTATPGGSYTYRWFRNGTLVPGGQFIGVGLADDGAQYRVDIVDAVTGCVFPSGAKPAAVTGTFDIGLTSTTPCENTPFTLTATPTRPVSTFQWLLNGSVISGQTSPTLQDTREGIYKVKGTIGTCPDSASFSVALAPFTPGALPAVFYICPDAADSTRLAVLNPGADFIDYSWSTNETTPTIVVTDAGRYSVTVTNSFGCVSEDDTEVFEDCEPRITGPNAFRPGGLNKDFFLYTFFIEDSGFEIFIFNRWGEMIYQSNARDFKWNGGYNNNAALPLPPGTYSYVVKYKSSYRPEEGVQEKRGGVVLLR